jgi:hypothetical protein
VEDVVTYIISLSTTNQTGVFTALPSFLYVSRFRYFSSKNASSRSEDMLQNIYHEIRLKDGGCLEKHFIS